MKYRPHTGSLSNAMKNCVSIPPTHKSLKSALEYLSAYIDLDTIEVEPYCSMPDIRIGWERTFLVTAIWNDGKRSPIGFTDEMPQQKKNAEISKEHTALKSRIEAGKKGVNELRLRLKQITTDKLREELGK